MAVSDLFGVLTSTDPRKHAKFRIWIRQVGAMFKMVVRAPSLFARAYRVHVRCALKHIFCVGGLVVKNPSTNKRETANIKSKSIKKYVKTILGFVSGSLREM